MQVIQTRLARQDILETAKFIANDNPEAGRRYFQAVKKTTEFITSNPKIGRQIIGHDNLRIWFVKGFEKHLIFYKIVNNELQIVRVLHSAMDYQRLLL